MPHYFAYGSNMDIAAMRARCPASRALGLARLHDHCFFIMRTGYASVRVSAGSEVLGLLWALDPRDEPALDDYEDVGGGLYRKITLRMVHEGRSEHALVYLGCAIDEGPRQPGYLEGVIAAARGIGLPGSYIAGLARFAGPSFGVETVQSWQ